MSEWMPLDPRFIRALLKRDLWKYFTNPTGYVFITLFIFLSAAAAFWQDRFFSDNLANLDQLNGVFPYLLLFFIPALTMSVWAEEKSRATDELLLTLPATSLEVTLGKYLAVLGIYSAALLLSLSHVLVLLWLGHPDLGLMLSNYLGYWLLGAQMIAIGMLASLLTANTTIAFVLGALLCATLGFPRALSAASEPLGRWLGPLGVSRHFAELASGVLSFSSLFYFLSFTAVMLYLNVFLLERRHWPRLTEGRPTWLHQGVRAAALLVAVASLNLLAARTSWRLDATSERLHSLGRQTRRLISELSAKRPVFIQAYVSPRVPEEYVETRADLLSVLDELDALGGEAVQVALRDTEPYSKAAREAREQFGITPREVRTYGGGRAGTHQVFLGLAFTCGAQEEVIPFLDRGLSPEYEITRSIRVVARARRRKIGVLKTGVRLFGGFDFETMQRTPPWSIVRELKKQYQVVEVPAAGPYPDDLEGLLVVLPSSLSQEEMDSLKEVIRNGTPTLLLVDPLPVINIGLSPSERAGANRNPFLQNQGPPPKPKGNVRRWLADLGVHWDPSRVIWDSYNPHPDLANLPPEVVFLGRGNGNTSTFNPEEPASAGLQELVLLYPGTIYQQDSSPYSFTPLVRSGFDSGSFAYRQMVERNFFGVSLNRHLPHRPDARDYVLAAAVRGKEKKSQETAAGQGGKASEVGRHPLRLIVIADLDFISEQFFLIRAQGPANLDFDNISFFLNSMDLLVGDDSFIALRNKRVRHRTLERVEEQTRRFIRERVENQKEAESEAKAALEEAQKRLNQKVAEVRGRKDLDARTKQIMARNLQEVESRRFAVLKKNIEARKKARIARGEEKMREQVRSIQGDIRAFAVLLPPLPVFLLGVLIFLRRQRREREGTAALRRLRASI